MIVTGDVLLAYPYLWRWQQGRGEDAGRKDRPVCVAIASRDQQGLTHLALLAISGTPAGSGQKAIEVPGLEIRRIGLKEHKRAWITVSEYNYDILERSFSLEAPRQPLKKLSPGFLRVVLAAFRPTLASVAARVDRV
jgi:hypothetical protein